MSGCLSTNAVTVEGVLYWSYGISNTSLLRSPDAYPETRGRLQARMEDLRVEAAIVQRVINCEVRHDHLRSIIEAKYGERPSAVWKCAELLRMSAKTQKVETLVLIVEDYCEFRKMKDREIMSHLKYGMGKSRETKNRYQGILSGWHDMAICVIGECFRERGWVE